MCLQITIDGPSGVGKSTLSRALANSLGFLFLNTGLIFRGLAWYFTKNEIPNENIPQAIEKLSLQNNFNFSKNTWFLDGVAVPESELINQDISSKASLISKYPEVRQYVLNIERNEAKENNIVMEGRDIGTTVFPNAILKIFLTATEETRAKRRYEELKSKGILENKTHRDIQMEIALRDKEDREREISPLVKPEDAVVLNSDNKSIDELIGEIKNLLEERTSR